MNEEHFLTELAIYLKPLSAEKKQEIIATYQELFTTGLAEGQSEEQIAKSLGKPKDLAADILADEHLHVEEKQIYQQGWQEFQPNKKEYNGPRFDAHDYTSGNNYEDDEQYEGEYPPRYERANPHSESFIKKAALFSFNILIMVWVWFSILITGLALWLTVFVMLAAPLWGIVAFFFFPMSAAIFQIAIMGAVFGVGLIGIAIGRPITRLFVKATKKYWQFNKAVFSGRAA